MSGDDGFADFLESVQRPLMNYLLYVTNSRSESEELFQETCLSAYRNWGYVREVERRVAWAIRVAHNKAANRRRKQQRERRARERRGLSESRSSESVPEAAHSRELREAVVAALQQLPRDQREAVCQKLWGDLTWVEIGHNLRTSDDTAARLFARGLRTIAPLLRAFQA